MKIKPQLTIKKNRVYYRMYEGLWYKMLSDNTIIYSGSKTFSATNTSSDISSKEMFLWYIETGKFILEGDEDED